jgi:hypothetical protein
VPTGRDSRGRFPAREDRPEHHADREDATPGAASQRKRQQSKFVLRFHHDRTETTLSTVPHRGP